MIPTPQGENDNKFAYGFDSNGNLLRKKVPVEGIDYKGRFGATTISGTEHEVSIGEKYFVCEDDGRDSFRIGDDVLISSRSDINCYMWGEIIGKDTVEEPMRLRVYIDDVSPLSAIVNDWILQVVARPKPGIEKDTSLTSLDPTTDGPFSFTVTAGKFFPVGGQVLIRPIDNRSVALTGYIVDYTADTLLVAKSACNLDESETFSAWSIALLDAPRRDDPLSAVSYTTLTIGAGTKTLTVQDDKFFPDLGSVMLRDISRASNGYMYGVVNAYSGTTLQVDVVNFYGGGTSSYWDVILLDGPGAIYSEASEDWGSIVGDPEINYGQINFAHDDSDDYASVADAVGDTDEYGTVI